MEQIAQQTGVLSSHRMGGQYRYKNLFQILPSVFKAEMLGQDHPLILEICFNPDVWPYRDESMWLRDLWEQERYEYIQSQSPKKKLDPTDPWVESYQQITKGNRLTAIIHELNDLLTLFTNHRFFSSNVVIQSWFIPMDENPM